MTKQIIAVFIAGLLHVNCCRGAEDHLVFLEGAELDTRIVSIDKQGRIACQDKQQTIALRDLYRIQRKRNRKVADSNVRVFLGGGGELVTREVNLLGRKCVFALAAGSGKNSDIPAKLVAGIRLGPISKDSNAARLHFREILGSRTNQDQVLAVSKGTVLTLKGVVVSLDSSHLVLQYKGKQRRMARDRVYGIVLAATPLTRKNDERMCRVELLDGSWLWADIARMENNELLLSIGAAELAVKWRQVKRIDIRSQRVVFVSDLSPAAILQQPMITFRAPWQADQSVMGKPLRFGGRGFTKGLGVHANCHLTYELAGKYRWFMSMIGIDAETCGKGDCVFRVVGDGKELFKQRVRASDPPRAIKVDLKGVRKIMLKVDAGENLDIGDHGDWGDARLIK